MRFPIIDGLKRDAQEPASDTTPMMHQDMVMACLTRASQDTSILRVAQRYARERDIPWALVYLELWDDQRENRLSSRNRALEQVALAERMGAITFVTKAADYPRAISEALAECERRELSPQLIVAGAAGAKANQVSRRAVAAITEASRGIGELQLVTSSDEPKLHTSWLKRFATRKLTLTSVVWAVTAVILAYAVTDVSLRILPASVPIFTNMYLIFLIASAIIAGRCGLIPGLITSVLGFLTLDYFYLPPVHSLQVTDVNDMISLGLYLVAATTVSVVNSEVYAEVEASETSEWRIQALLQVYKIALHAHSRDEALAELHENLHQFLRAEIAVFMPSLIQPANLQQVWPEAAAVTPQDLVILEQCWQDMQKGTYAHCHNPSTGWRFEPLTSAAGELGMLAVRMPEGQAIGAHYENYLRTIAELVASILEKIESVDMKEESRVRDERDKLRTSLLASVSHDLKTPLASIIGALSVHRSMYEKLPEAQRRELTEAALIEAQRLDSFITNILDLAKIESGAVKFKRQWQSPEDMVLRVKKRMRLRLEGHAMMITPPATAIEVEMDAVISEQALANVLDNAIKYTPLGSPIEIRMETGDEAFSIHVRDYGPGIPEADQERIFDKYTRLQRQDTQVAGTGLGLALARAAMRGQGGDIHVKNHAEGGATFTLTWPQWRVASASFTSARQASAKMAG